MAVSAVHVIIGGSTWFRDAALAAAEALRPEVSWTLRLTVLTKSLALCSSTIEGPTRDEQRTTFVGFATDAVAENDGDAIYALQKMRISVLGAANSEIEHPMFCRAAGRTVAESFHLWLQFPAVTGRIFVVEGGDGAGKQTQVARLVQRLTDEGYPVSTLDYPHDAAHCGALIREALSGRLGSIRSMHPLLFASLYGMNRLDTLPQLRYWQQRGHNVVLDRYLTANFGHQASKCDKDEERRAAIETLWKFEVEWLGLPAPHRVAYLDLPPDVAMRAMLADGTRRELDIHERAGLEYKNKVRSSFLWCGDTYGWDRVECMDGDVRRSREDVHEDLFVKWRNDLVNKRDC